MRSTPPTVARRRKRLRTAVEHVRTDGPSDADRQRDVEANARRAVDDDVVALTETAFADVGDAQERLAELQRRFERRDDRRAVFLGIYGRMTDAVADGIVRDRFEDADWVADYLVAFANLYRRAVHDDETGNREAVPDPWLVAFDAARDGDCLVAQDAALGVNAHINYDLSLALDDAGIAADRATRRADHDGVIDVIRGLVDETQAALAARDADGIAALDDALDAFDERLVVFTIEECRDSAWRTAVAMRSRFRTRRRLARWLNDATATGAAHLIHGTRSSDRLHDVLADLERGPDDDTE